jgi:3-oxoacyl-[acyl-carrier protein] reductase
MTEQSSSTQTLKDRVAIVTGAASGIGAASACAFVRAGARVLGVDRVGSGLAEAAKQAGFHALEADLTDPGATVAIIKAVEERFGRLDIVFNNAGVGGYCPIGEMTDEAWDSVQAINLRAAFRLSRDALPLLVQSRTGRILMTGSVMSENTDFGLASYCASKAGLVGLTRSLALELGRNNITVNAILPGAIRTGMTAPIWQSRPETLEAWANKSVLKRVGEPEDIARVALFLASDDAGFITGQAISVDGGMRLRV